MSDQLQRLSGIEAAYQRLHRDVPNLAAAGAVWRLPHVPREQDNQLSLSDEDLNLGSWESHST
jgi:hypothetical protein